MNDDEKRALIERYLDAYNAFDIDRLLAVIHPDIEFKNVTRGGVNVSASGMDEFRKLANQSKGLFTSRKQTVVRVEAIGDEVFIEVMYEGVLATDLPNGMKKGETLRLNGRSEFGFRDGKICKIIDMS